MSHHLPTNLIHIILVERFRKTLCHALPFASIFEKLFHDTKQSLVIFDREKISGTAIINEITGSPTVR